jgi:hypothetical protein
VTQPETKQASYTPYRPSIDYAIAQDGAKTQRSTSPFAFNFTAQHYTFSNKYEGGQGPKRREERDHVSSIPKR